MNPAPAQRPLRVLCLEDNARDQELIGEKMVSEGLACEMICTRTSEEFLAALAESRFDLVLSDFSIPSYNGMAALAAVQRLAPETPFVFVSGTIGEERAVESLKAGATDYVLKNHLARLVPAVNRALREASERRTRRAAEASLRESESRFRQVTENIDEVFWLASARETKLLYISPAYERIWGQSADKLYQDLRVWFEAIHPSDRERVFEAAMAKQVQGTYDETYRIVRPDGSLRWIWERAFAIRNEAGEIFRIVGTAQDITEHRALEEQLRHSQKMDGIGQLAGGIAHDFNNLLAVMRGNAELLLMKPEQLTPDARDCLSHIAAAAGRAGNLTRQLLTFSRKQVMQASPVVLSEAVANLAKMLKRIIKEDIHLHCESGAGLPYVDADIGMIEQALVNLVLNARDAMPRGGKLLIGTNRVNFDGAYAHTHPEARSGEFVCLSVSDTGTGIAPEHLPRVFEPFFTTKDPGRGTGLGLATVYGIVRQHRGWIEVSSRLGQGTTFMIYLPVVPPPQKKAGASEIHTGLRGGTESILVVEDETPVRIVTRRVLETFGYKVFEAASTKEALELWRDHQQEIALLLTDLVMPDAMTGHELADRLRAENPKLKVVLMSGYSAAIAGKDTEFFRKTRTYFLQKPCPSRNLIETVRSCLDEAM
ncbi:MAG TPA: response regulator [Candidatus Acidoferrum sp.]|jgi:two-component system cell cycle sensor histidine kinase/response regulator CckA|nr:response regulator [Candidatus Acidoferrum sp.]